MMITQQDVNKAYQDGLRQGRREILGALNGLDKSASCTIRQFQALVTRVPPNERQARAMLGLDPVTLARRAPEPALRTPAVRTPPRAKPTAPPARRMKPTEESAAAMGRRIAEKFNGAEQTETDGAAAVGRRIAAQLNERTLAPC